MGSFQDELNFITEAPDSNTYNNKNYLNLNQTYLSTTRQEDMNTFPIYEHFDTSALTLCKKNSHENLQKVG